MLLFQTSHLGEWDDEHHGGEGRHTPQPFLFFFFLNNGMKQQKLSVFLIPL